MALLKYNYGSNVPYDSTSGDSQAKTKTQVKELLEIEKTKFIGE